MPRWRSERPRGLGEQRRLERRASFWFWLWFALVHILALCIVGLAIAHTPGGGMDGLRMKLHLHQGMQHDQSSLDRDLA